jgi:transposase
VNAEPAFTRKGSTVQPDFNADCWIGIDISRDWVDVVVLVEEQVKLRGRWTRSDAELGRLAEQLKPYAPRGVVLEPTGGFEGKVIAALAGVDLPVMRINPKRVRDFARAHGLLAKTDALDAYVLALFGRRMQPPLRPLPEKERQELAAWVGRQQQLTRLRAMERVRLQQVSESALRDSIERVIAMLGEELERFETELLAWVAQSASWSEQEALLRTAPGVGAKTARVLLAHLPELGRLNRRQIAALAGLAPFACDSGNWRGQRHIRGGRAVVRVALYMASWVNVRLNGPFRDFYLALVGRGKPRKVALLAVARKLLLALNEMLRTSQPWRCPAV